MTDGSRAERWLAAPSGPLELLRHPYRPRSNLRAWDAADAYLLRHLAEDRPMGPLLVVNDGFGALTAGLRAAEPVTTADTTMAEVAILENLDRNGLAAVTVIPAVDGLADGTSLATVVIKVPKSLGQLEDQLHRLRPYLGPTTTIVGAGMVRHIHTSTLELFQTIIGPTTTSLAEQKARLIHCQPDPDLEPPENPWPMVWTHDGITVHNHGGVFSARSVDVGTRFLLEHLPDTAGPVAVVDLGCGNGIVGAATARANPDAAVTFVDASARAVSSTRRTWADNFGDRDATIRRTDRLVNVVEPGSIDVIVNNPPFHEDRAIGDATAWDMFVDSQVSLRRGGRLIVVGNRHLGHHARLKKIFGNCETVASNRKFVVLSARR
ncbi:MAG: methyltransferase [Actinomycetota bacterium]